LANENNSVEQKKFIVGGVETLTGMSSHSKDLVIAMNILRYLSREEESGFWIETKRVLKPEG